MQRVCFHLEIHLCFAYAPAMGTNRRAEEREFHRRAARNFGVILTWQERDAGRWFVDFLDPDTRQAVTRQRVYGSAAIIAGLVARSQTDLGHGPRRAFFDYQLAEGQGEVQIELSPAQYERLCASA